MSSHEIKNCPRCNKPFECKPGNIIQCHCFGMNIKPELNTFLEQHYSECLCHDCLHHLQQEGNLLKEKNYYNTQILPLPK